MITFAKQEMLPELKQIWKECFGDEEAYINFFYQHWFYPDSIVIWTEHEKPVAMLHMIPTTLITSHGIQKVRYIYAVATLKKYQRRGIATKLMEYGKRMVQEPFFLVPSGEQLFSFYEKIGFHTAFWIKEVTYSREEIEKQVNKNKKDTTIISKIKIQSNIDAREYQRIRDDVFKRIGYIRWEEEAIQYTLLENKLVGGDAYKIFYNGEEHIALIRICGRILYIVETTMDFTKICEKDRNVILYHWIKETNIIAVTIRVPIYSNIHGHQKPFAMIDTTIEKDNSMYYMGYANLIWD